MNPKLQDKWDIVCRIVEILPRRTVHLHNGKKVIDCVYVSSIYPLEECMADQLFIPLPEKEATDAAQAEGKIPVVETV